MKKKYFMGGFRVIASALFFASSLAFSTIMADTFIAVNKETKVFDEPDATGYVTLNQKNEEVKALPGMVFKLSENKGGWNLVEYSPGLRGYVSDQVKQSKFTLPKAGTYKVANKPADKLTVENNGSKWTATIGGKTYQGELSGNIVVFFDDKKIPAYSIVDFGNGPIVMNYDNSVTKFF